LQGGIILEYWRRWLVDWCFMTLSAQKGHIVPQWYEIYHVGPGDKMNTQRNNTLN